MPEVTKAEKTTGPPIIVRARGITKSFGEDDARIPVLKGVDLDVAMGEILLLVGPSGSGKTTLLSVIAGILDLDEGEVRVLGKSISRIISEGKNGFPKQVFRIYFSGVQPSSDFDCLRKYRRAVVNSGSAKKRGFESGGRDPKGVGDGRTDTITTSKIVRRRETTGGHRSCPGQ